MRFSHYLYHQYIVRMYFFFVRAPKICWGHWLSKLRFIDLSAFFRRRVSLTFWQTLANYMCLGNRHIKINKSSYDLTMWIALNNGKLPLDDQAMGICSGDWKRAFYLNSTEHICPITTHRANGTLVCWMLVSLVVKMLGLPGIGLIFRMLLFWL